MNGMGIHEVAVLLLDQLGEEGSDPEEANLRGLLVEALEMDEWSEETASAWASAVAAARAELRGNYYKRERIDPDSPSWSSPSEQVMECRTAADKWYSEAQLRCLGMPYDPDAWPLEPGDVERCLAIVDGEYLQMIDNCEQPRTDPSYPIA